MKLYVGNLPFSVTEEALKRAFSEFGEIEEATVIVDKFSKRSKGFGFVTFADDEAGKKAIAEMNEKELEGRNLKVSEAKPMEDRPKREFNRNSGSSGRRFGNRGSSRDGDRRPSSGGRFGGRPSNGSGSNRSFGGNNSRPSGRSFSQRRD